MNTESDSPNSTALAAARELWIKRLIDPSRANTLLFFRDLKVGSLDLTDRPEAVARLLEGREAPREELEPTDGERGQSKVRAALATLRQKALSNLEEKGVDTLHLALGLASWPALDGGKPYQSPVLLLPVQITPRGPGGLDLALKPAGEPKINPVLLHVLAEDFRLALDDAQLLRECSAEDEDGTWRLQPEQLFDALRAAAHGKVREFGVAPRAVLANFHFARMAMVEDLRRNAAALAQSRIAAALAGDSAARAAFAQSGATCPPPQLDARPAVEEHYVLDADPTQQAVIEAVEVGQDLVVQGPPGTGKSQTIANLIAQSVAAGKRVLFVAEKRAALDAVLKRLSDPRVGLGHLVLDLHGAAVSRRAVMAKLRDTLDTLRTAQRPENIESLHREFEQRRAALNAHAQRVNQPRAPLGLSVVQILGRLLALPPQSHTKARLVGNGFAQLDAAALEELRDAQRALASQPQLHLGSDARPWSRAQLENGAQAQAALALAREGASERFPQLREPLAQVASECGCRAPATLAEVEHLLAVLRDARDFEQRFRPELFEQDLEQLSEALEPAATGAFGRATAWLFNTRYRAARATLLAARRTPAPAEVLHRESIEALKLQRRWREHAPNSKAPREAPSANALEDAAKELRRVCDELRRFVPALPGNDKPLQALGEQLAALEADGLSAFEMPRALAARAALERAGFGRVLDELRRAPLDAQFMVARCEHAMLATALEQAFAADPQLAAFRGREHEQLVEEFRRLDRERLKLAAQRVRWAHANAAIEAMNAHPEQADFVRREAQKKARHRPLRELFSEAPDVLTRLAPCWVASPLSVSQLLAPAPGHFDLVVFDEASQVLPEEAVPALYRARQFVAAGDQHQLPPTTFFASAIDEADVEEALEAQAAAHGATSGFESVLDTLASFAPSRMLEWHYRSQDERLITFSNVEIYDQRLVTFPSARAADAVTHVLTPPDAALGAQTHSPSPEVARVVELVLEHARTRPNESLGVITLGLPHARRIEAALDRARLEMPQELAAFFALEREERFFVKNLETVQGDERDAIVLSLGCGRAAGGQLDLRAFGPLNGAAGYRRLNVAVTRARRRMCVVSSFRADELDLGRSEARGVALLKAYLAYAANGGQRLVASERAEEFPSNAFESDVRSALEARGVKLRAQFGAGRFRIDLVAMHPERAGEPVLAIECDGARYHSGATARDRDRLRQSQLERLGWRFHRVWSTDWFRERELELERALAAYRAAIEGAPSVLPAPVATAASATPSEATPAVDAGPRRPPRPKFPAYKTIDRYTDAELEEIVRWIAADGVLRTDDEWIRLAAAELPFERLGSKIRERLASIVRRVR